MNDRPIAARAPGVATTGLTPVGDRVHRGGHLPTSSRSTTISSATTSASCSCSRRSPARTFPRWFASSWMDEIWGYVPDEVRPFPALSYQLTALGGPVSPLLHHALNILIHAANGLLVMAIAMRAAALGVRAAAFAGLVFVLLPVHAESVAWITGRVDSMPALFYLASFLAYVRSRQRGVAASLHLVARPLLRGALHQAEHDHDGGDARRLRRHRRAAPDSFRPVAFVRPYVPFAVMTAGYLWLRCCSSVRWRARGRSTPGGSRTFASCSAVTSGTSSPATERAGDRRLARAGGRCRRVAEHARQRCAFRLCRPGACPERSRGPRRLLVLRADLVGDRRAADRGGRLPLAAARVSRGSRLGNRARHCVRGGVAGPGEPRVASRGRRRRRRSCCSSTSCRSIDRVHEWRTHGRGFAPGRARRAQRRALGARGQPDHHRCARAELGVGVAVRRAAAVPADRLARPRLHHLSARAELLHRAVVRGNAPDDPRLVGRAPAAIPPWLFGGIPTPARCLARPAPTHPVAGPRPDPCST